MYVSFSMSYRSLQYHHNEHDPAYKTIALYYSSGVRSADVAPAGEAPGFAFEVVCMSRIFRYRAESAASRDMWVTTLQWLYDKCFQRDFEVLKAGKLVRLSVTCSARMRAYLYARMYVYMHVCVCVV